MRLLKLSLLLGYDSNLHILVIIWPLFFDLMAIVLYLVLRNSDSEATVTGFRNFSDADDFSWEETSIKPQGGQRGHSLTER